MKKLILVLALLIVILTAIFLKASKNQANAQATIQFSTWGSSSEIRVLNSIISDFEQNNPNIKIELIHIPQNYFQKLHLLFASNLAPDVVFLNNYYLPLYVKANLLENISSQIEDEEIYFSESINCFKSAGNLYAIPRDVSSLVVYYNKDLFDKYNVPYPTSNWTYADLITIGRKLTVDIDNDGDTDLFAINFEYKPVLFWLPYLTSNGGGIFTEDNKPILGTKKSIASLQFYADLVNKYKIAPSKSQSASKTSAQMFIQSELAMQLSGRWLVPKYRSDINFNWDIVEFPKGSDGSIMPIDASGWAISKQSKYKDESLLFLKFLSSPQSISRFTRSGLITPARKDIAYSNIFITENAHPKNAVAFLNSIETGVATPVSKNYSCISDLITAALEPLFSGKQQGSEIITKSLIEKIEQEML